MSLDQPKKLADEQDAGGFEALAAQPLRPQPDRSEPVVLHPVPVHKSAFEDLEPPTAA